MRRVLFVLNYDFMIPKYVLPAHISFYTLMYVQIFMC